jgi:hypothetical protein
MWVSEYDEGLVVVCVVAAAAAAVVVVVIVVFGNLVHIPVDHHLKET